MALRLLKRRCNASKQSILRPSHGYRVGVRVRVGVKVSVRVRVRVKGCVYRAPHAAAFHSGDLVGVRG